MTKKGRTQRVPRQSGGPDRVRPVPQYPRPALRLHCEDAPRPCPYVACRYHLALELLPDHVRLQYDDPAEIAALEQTCALDVADAGEHTMQDVARLMGISSSNLARVEGIAIGKLGDYFRGLDAAEREDMLPLLKRMLRAEGSDDE